MGMIILGGESLVQTPFTWVAKDLVEPFTSWLNHVSSKSNSPILLGILIRGDVANDVVSSSRYL